MQGASLVESCFWTAGNFLPPAPRLRSDSEREVDVAGRVSNYQLEERGIQHVPVIPLSEANGEEDERYHLLDTRYA